MSAVRPEIFPGQCNKHKPRNGIEGEEEPELLEPLLSLLHAEVDRQR